MKPALLDVNVLLALVWASHQHHEVAHDWFRDEAKFGWRTCALTQLGFIRLSSNPAFTADAATPQEAAALLQRFVSHRKHAFWQDLPPIAESAVAHALGHRQVMDSYLVELARHHRGRLVTFDTRLAVHARKADEVTTVEVSLEDE